MNAITSHVGLVSGDLHSTKAIRAGRDFEAILLNTLFSSLEDAFVRLPGGQPNHATELYKGIATQALSAGIAQSGGIGLSKLVEVWVKKHERGRLPRV